MHFEEKQNELRGNVTFAKPYSQKEFWRVRDDFDIICETSLRILLIVFSCTGSDEKVDPKTSDENRSDDNQMKDVLEDLQKRTDDAESSYRLVLT